MPYAKCPNCGSVFHLRLTPDGAAQWGQKHAAEIARGDIASLQCFYCWKELRELEVVQVLAVPAGNAEVAVGDIGAVVAILQAENGEVGYEVECVAESGESKWRCTFSRSQLRSSAVQPPGASHAEAGT